jgi:2-keto-4-pentenoate hydratase/2-oxohepta-3-ene-1,7-dioic acid hydratase in catechol pathway
MVDHVRDVDKPLAKPAVRFKASMDGQRDKGKGRETFGPIGPWFVSKDEIKDPQNLDMWLNVNGERRQNGNTRTMIFNCGHLVCYCSQFFVMEPDGIIISGTPPSRRPRRGFRFAPSAQHLPLLRHASIAP